MLMALPLTINADAATLCTTAGADGSPRCYATANYTPKTAPVDVMDGFYAFTKFSNDSVPDGFLQDAVWVIFDNNDILEAGMFDPSTGSPKFVVAINGVTSGTSTHSPSNNVAYELTVHDSDLNNTWTMKSDTLTNTKNMGLIDAYTSKVGVEAQFTNAPNNTTDFNTMYMHHNGVWKLLSTTNVYQGWTETTGWDMDPCGSGNESMYHVKAGKGTQSC
jgi:hypothetical protein